MGPAGLTAVFGMGTGVAPPVWSPEKRPRGGPAAAVAVLGVVGQAPTGRWDRGRGDMLRDGTLPIGGSRGHVRTGGVGRGGRRARVGVVKSLGC